MKSTPGRRDPARTAPGVTGTRRRRCGAALLLVDVVNRLDFPGSGSLGRAMVERLAPRDGDYFVLKPKHSGFYCTTLDLLLRYLGAQTLVLTGIATDICIFFFTANDAYMRDYRLFVPSDCCAANERSEHALALRRMRKLLKAETRPSPRLTLPSLCRRGSTRSP
jgi:Isochorismatase family